MIKQSFKVIMFHILNLMRHPVHLKIMDADAAFLTYFLQSLTLPANVT